jgi:Ran GTPase-activating protein (RanGAP) involved in mRNA processing and transport
LLSVNFSNNNFPDVIGANIFASIGIYCPNMQIIDISNNSLTYNTFNHPKVSQAFEVGFKKLSKLIIRNNLLGSKGFVNLCGVVKNARKLNLLDVSYNGINKDVFENQNVVDFFSGDLQFFYTIYYEGNYLPKEEMKFFIKSILTNLFIFTK